MYQYLLPPLLTPSTLSWTPILLCHSIDIVSAQVVDAFTDQDAPNIVPHSNWPGRDAPISDLEAASMSAVNLLAEAF